MFDQLDRSKKRELPEYTVVSVGLHALLVGGLLALAGLRVHQARKKEVAVSFVGPGKSKNTPAPPPPPAGKKHLTPKRKVAKLEIPKQQLIAPRIDPPPDDPALEDEGVEGGVEGGVAGGVVGGVLGGVVGSTGGGGMQPAAERPKPRNVPPFLIARDMIRQDPPRMSEVFKEAHRGQTVIGMYKVCVDTDGHVFEVTPVQAVEGANDEIVEGIEEAWLYKPQRVPVCFLYNLVVRVQQ